MNRLITYSLVLLGTILSLSGVVFVVLYVYEGVILPWGRSDQSLLFWYLPFLFIGFLAVVLGALILARGLVRLKIMRKER